MPYFIGNFSTIRIKSRLIIIPLDQEPKPGHLQGFSLALEDYRRERLIRAVKSGNARDVDSLLIYDANLQEGGETLLHLAGKHYNVVAVLLRSGANPNLRNTRRSTPLHDAALSGSGSVVNMLLQRGADPDIRD